VSRTKATRPRDAMHAFAEAIAQRDVTRILAVLTQPRREGLQHQIEGFVNGIGKHVNDKMEEVGRRAELNWEDAGISYRIVLKKEDDGEWRVDDIYIRPHQKDEDPDKGGAVIPEDF
jgi:ketosteroid isomerase-like protein